jgi:glyoxylase-like metal-dependent hydrolase (beta-lactamase superfamily II)
LIPFNKTFEFDYGVPVQVTPRTRRVVAPNPGRFTFTGTGTYIVGRGAVALIDPGPDRDDHFNALLAALQGETVSHVFVTHQHMDHSPLARRVAAHFGALVCGRSGAVYSESGGAVRLDAEDDPGFRADIELEDGWTVEGEGWSLKAIHTPGHTANHFCFAVPEDNVLLCGDHLMAWSTAVVSPPDGHMGDYLASLRRIRAENFAMLIPAHGPEIPRPAAFIDAYIAHRVKREQQILDRLASGPLTIAALVDDLYRDVERALHPAARHMVMAHLIHMTERGVVTSDGALSIGATFRLARHARVA